MYYQNPSSPPEQRSPRPQAPSDPPGRRRFGKYAAVLTLCAVLVIAAGVFLLLRNPPDPEAPALRELSVPETVCPTESAEAPLPQPTLPAETAEEIPCFFGEQDMWHHFLVHYDFLTFTPGWNTGPAEKEAWSYWIQDINEDGLSELFLHTPESGAYHLWIFTMQDGAPVLVHHQTTTWNTFYSARDQAVCLRRPYAVDGWQYSQFYRLEGTGLRLLFEISQSENKDDQEAYLIRDGQKEPIPYDMDESDHGPVEEEHFSSWTDLVPDVTFPEAEELSGFLGTGVDAFTGQFPGMRSAGSWGVNYTNGTIDCSAREDDRQITSIGICFPGEPYALCGLQAGMDKAQAQQLLADQGARQEEADGVYSVYALPDGSRLRLRLYDRGDKVIVKSLFLSDQ